MIQARNDRLRGAGTEGQGGKLSPVMSDNEMRASKRKAANSAGTNATTLTDLRTEGGREGE